jgi:hypothetical protein
MKVRACGAKDYVHFCAEFIHVPSVTKEPRLKKGRSWTLTFGYVFGAMLGVPGLKLRDCWWLTLLHERHIRNVRSSRPTWSKTLRPPSQQQGADSGVCLYFQLPGRQRKMDFCLMVALGES